MGKKRSKAAKKKQAKVAKHFGGIQVGKVNNGLLQNNMKKKQEKKIQSANKSLKKANDISKKPKKTNKGEKVVAGNRKEEQHDFEKEMASLQERTRTTSASRNKKQSLSLFSSLATATFKAGPETTEDWIEQTAQKVEAWSDIGQPRHPWDVGGILRQSEANDWQIAAPAPVTNSFQVLEEDSDEEKKMETSFQFAPASFAVKGQEQPQSGHGFQFAPASFTMTLPEDDADL